MESLVGYGSDSENSETGTPNRHRLQLNQTAVMAETAKTDLPTRTAAELQAEWESFAELIGDSALQGPMPVDIMSIPLPDGKPCTAAAALPMSAPISHNEEENKAVTRDVDDSSSDDSDRARSKSRSQSRSRSRSRSSSGSSSGSSSDSESDDSSGPSVSKKSKLVNAADCGSIVPENIPMPDAESPSCVKSPSGRIRNDSVTSEKSVGSKKDIESANEDDGKIHGKEHRSHRRHDRSRSRDRKRRSRSRDRRRRRRKSRSRSKDRRRRRSRDRKRSRSPRKRHSRERKYKRRSRSRSRDRKRRRRRSGSRGRTRRSRGHRSRSRDRRRHDGDGGSKSKDGGAMKNRTLTFKEELKKSFIAAQREIEKTGTCSLNLGEETTYKHNEKPSNLPLYDNPLLAVTGGTDPTKNPSSSNTTPQLAFLQTMQAMHKKAQELTGVSVPKYYNPAAVNPLKYAEQVQKRKLLWQKKDTKEETPTTKASQWQDSVFSQDQDGKVSAKFRKLMGIKGGEVEGKATENNENVEEKKRKQQELFQRLDQEYAMARMATHTHRGIGLGFSSQGTAVSGVSTATSAVSSSSTGGKS